MSIIDRFHRVDAWLVEVLPQWPVSLILLVSLCTGLVASLLIALIP
jgi:hypothetical protein